MGNGQGTRAKRILMAKVMVGVKMYQEQNKDDQICGRIHFLLIRAGPIKLWASWKKFFNAAIDYSVFFFFLDGEPLKTLKHKSSWPTQ